MLLNFSKKDSSYIVYAYYKAKKTLLSTKRSHTIKI